MQLSVNTFYWETEDILENNLKKSTRKKSFIHLKISSQQQRNIPIKKGSNIKKQKTFKNTLFSINFYHCTYFAFKFISFKVFAIHSLNNSL